MSKKCAEDANERCCRAEYSFHFSPPRLQLSNILNLLTMQLKTSNSTSSITLHLHDISDQSSVLIIDLSPSIDSLHNMAASKIESETFDITAEVYPFWNENLTRFQFEIEIEWESENCHELPVVSQAPVLTVKIQETVAEYSRLEKMQSDDVLNSTEASKTKRNVDRRNGHDSEQKGVVVENELLEAAPNCENMWDREFLERTNRDQYEILGNSCCTRNLMLNFT